jgi:hypothetical protein
MYKVYNWQQNNYKILKILKILKKIYAKNKIEITTMTHLCILIFNKILKIANRFDNQH